MKKNQTELFGHFFYSQDLSYEELIACEATLKEIVHTVLETQQAEFIHFEAKGDSLLVQCVFNSFAENLFHNICDGLAPHMHAQTECKLLCVDKTLQTLLIYTISNTRWQEACLSLPTAGPIEKSLQTERAKK